MTREENDKVVCTAGDREIAGRKLATLARLKAASDEASEKYEAAREELQKLMETRHYDAVESSDGDIKAVYFPAKETEKVDEKKLWARVVELKPEIGKLVEKITPDFTKTAVTKAFVKLTKI